MEAGGKTQGLWHCKKSAVGAVVHDLGSGQLVHGRAVEVVVKPAKFLYERWSGLYSENGKYLYINDGMGYVMYPMRIGTNPSITVITLESEKRR